MTAAVPLRLNGRIRILFFKGGVGSGNFGHAGRPGQIGGSMAKWPKSLDLSIQSGEDSPTMDNLPNIRALSAEQARQFVDCRQIFEALRSAQHDLARRFAGSMAWKHINGQDYLYRRRGKVERSLGPRSPETEAMEVAFRTGKARLEGLAAGLTDRLERMAPVNVALAINRVPNLVARVVRRLDSLGFLGSRVAIVGTNALFAYEAAAGSQIHSSLLATTDVDFALDARKRMALLTDLPPEGMIGLLRQIDQSFTMQHPGDFRAVNRTGFMVDLITPAPRNRLRSLPPRRLGPDGDMTAAEIDKLQWLVEAPRFDSTAIAENGLPVRLSAADPRYFAAHKLWLAERPDRDNEKRVRDHQQALSVAMLLAGPLSRLDLSDSSLAQLPPPLRDQLRAAVAAAPRERPEW